MVIAELIWTLLSYYKGPKAEVIEKVSIIISTPNLHLVDKTIVADSLVLYSQKNTDFIDAYNALFLKFHGLEKIYSYDEDFDAIEGIEREEPLPEEAVLKFFRKGPKKILDIPLLNQ